MSPRAQENDTSFTLSTAQNNQWLNAPIFVSAYEHGEHVYFFMSEPALEMQQQVRYSRAVRICKTDEGIITDHEGDIFRTFQKARMVCTVQGSSGSIPFYYNDLASTFLDTDVLYGTFNSPINGPAGGAICKFSFDSSQDGSITKVFDDGNYLIQDNSATSGQNDWVKSVRTPFSCPGDGRSAADVRDHHLKLILIQSCLFWKNLYSSQNQSFWTKLLPKRCCTREIVRKSSTSQTSRAISYKS